MLTRDAGGAALLGGVPLREILARAGVATPAYVYDLDAIALEATQLSAGFGGAPHLCAYAVKASSAGPIVRTLAQAGCGADVVSGGELVLVLACGVPPEKVLYSGVAKTGLEIERAIGTGDRGILALQVESVEEIARVEARAAAVGRRARVSIRINPSVLADTHSHVATGHDEAKFGVLRDDLPAALEALASAAHVDLVGLSCHVGSQLTRTAEYLDAARALLGAVKALEASRPGKPALELIDFGGGFGIDYGAGCPVRPADFAAGAAALVAAEGLAGRRLVVEPGRSMVGAHGVLCAGVITTKRARERRWLMIDAGMNDLLRPALYGALHRIEPLDQPPGGATWRVVGPVCESSDDFGEHALPDPPPASVVIRDAGAYGFTMASQYNGRALPVEVFVSRGEVTAVSAPRSVADWVEERAGIARRG